MPLVSLPVKVVATQDDEELIDEAEDEAVGEATDEEIVNVVLW